MHSHVWALLPEIKFRKSIGLYLKNQWTIQRMNQVENQLANQPNEWIWKQSFQEINLYPLPIKIVREWETMLRSLIAANNRYLLQISLILKMRSITQLLLPTVPTIYGICHHQSILIPVNYVALPEQKLWNDVVKCTLTQQHSWIRKHICARQAHKVSNLPWCYSLLSVPLDMDCHVWAHSLQKKLL